MRDQKSKVWLRITGAALLFAGTALWLFIAWFMLAAAAWAIADSGERLTPAEWAVVVPFFAVPPAALALLATTVWTGRRPGSRQFVLAAALAAASCGYAAWALV